jgi:hypothetical protein
VTESIRQATVELMKATDRPVTVSEIREYIRGHHPPLSTHLDGKRKDYLRITISISPKRQFSKYRHRVQPQSRDAHTIFWGLRSKVYSPDWLVVPEEPSRPKHSSRSKDRPPLSFESLLT